MSQSVKYNLNQKGKRKTLYDQDGYSRANSSYIAMDDHKTMKGHVFADFQKEQFKQKKLTRKRRFMMRLVVLAITILLILLFLYAWENNFFSIFDSTWSPTN